MAPACCSPQPCSCPAASRRPCSAVVRGTKYIFNGDCLAHGPQRRIAWGVGRTRSGALATLLPEGLPSGGCASRARPPVGVTPWRCTGTRALARSPGWGELLLRGVGLGARGGVRDGAKQQQGCWQPPGQGASHGSSCHLGRGGRANSQRGNGTCLKGGEQLLLAAGVETGSAGLAAAPRGRWRAGSCLSHLHLQPWPKGCVVLKKIPTCEWQSGGSDPIACWCCAVKSPAPLLRGKGG